MGGVANPLQNARIAIGKADSGLSGHRTHELAVIFTDCGRAQLRIQCRVHHIRCRHCNQRHRQNPARAKRDPTVHAARHQMDLTIAAKARGAHRNRLDHRTIPADLRPCRVDLGLAVFDQGHVGRRTADITDQRPLHTRQPPCTNQRSGRAAQDGFDRAGARLFRRHQCTIATHNHHLRSNPQL